MPPVVVGVAAGIAAAGVVSTAAAIAIGVAAAALTYAATPEFGAGSFSNEAYAQQQMLRSPAEPRRGIYGRSMVSGPLIFAEETGEDNEYLHLVVALAGHRCDAIETVYFGDEVAWTSNGGIQSKFASHARIKPHLGAQTAADSQLVSECRAWTNKHVGNGVTYLYVRLKYDVDVFPNGVPNIKALVKGKPVYDPRLDSTNGGAGSHRFDDPTSWQWSDNWALCVLDYTRFESGVGALMSEIDLPSYALAAQDSDEFVEYQTDDWEPRYTCNGTYTQDTSPASILEKMLTAGAGMQVYVGGKYHLYSGVYQGPEVLTLTEDDCAGDVDISPYTSRSELCNAVRGTFVDPESFYQPTDFTPYESAYYRDQDNGEYIDHDIDLPFTQSSWTAQRLAKLHLELNRAGMQITFPTKMIGLAVSVGKVVRLQLPSLGINQTFMVADWQFDFGRPVKLILRETNADIFEFDKGAYTQRDLAPNTTLPDPSKVPTVSGVVWVPSGDDANWQGELSWNAPGNNSAYRYRLEVVNQQQTVVYQASIEGTRHHVPKLDAGTYNLYLWAVNLFSNRSNLPASLTIGADAPPPVNGILADIGALSLTLRPQTAAAVAATTQFEVKGSLNTVLNSAEHLGQGKEVQWPNRHPNTLYYVWARSVNNYGVGAWFGPVGIQTSTDNSAVVQLIGEAFNQYTWFAWADDNAGTGFTTNETQGEGKNYLGVATEKKTSTPSGNWQDYTWTKIKTEIPPVFTPEEETQLDNLMAGKLPAGDKDMLAAQDALNNPALANNLLTSLALLNNGIDAASLNGETPAGAQAKSDAAKSAAEAYAKLNADLAERNAISHQNLLVDANFEEDFVNDRPIAFPHTEVYLINNHYYSSRSGNSDWALISTGKTACVVQGTSVGDQNGYVDVSSNKIAVTPGQRVGFSVYVGNHRSLSCAFIYFFDANDNNLGNSYIDYSDINLPGGKTLATYSRIFSYGTVPEFAVTARAVIRKYDTLPGYVDSYMFYVKPQFSVWGNNQVSPPEWTPPNANPTAKMVGADIAGSAAIAQLAAESYALTKSNLAEVTAKAYADGKVTAEETRAIADAQAKADAAKTAAIAAAATDATTKANNAKAAAETYALTKANLAETTAKAYADGIVSDEEARAIADAQARANAAEAFASAKAYLAETTAKAYADGKVTAEETRAIADAQAKADIAASAHNLIPNASFKKVGTNNLPLGFLSLGGNLSNHDFQAWWPSSGTDWALTQDGATAITHQYAGSDNPDLYFDVATPVVSVTQGQRIGFSVYTGSHRAKSAAFMYLYNSAGGIVTNSWVVYNDQELSGGKSIDGYKRLFSYVDIPAGVAYVRGVIRKYDTMPYGGDSYVFYVRPQISVLGQTQTQPPVWVEGTALLTPELVGADPAGSAASAESNSISTISTGSFPATLGLIDTLMANTALFNQLKSRFGVFGGLTSETLASQVIATNHLQSGAVTADKITADTALIQKLIANQGLFNQLQAQLGVFGGLSANSIATNSITTDKLHVLAKGLVNNVSTSGTRAGWSEDGTNLVVVNHIHRGMATKALEASSNTNAISYSDSFEIDNTKIYEVNFTIHRVSGGGVGVRYLGMYADGDNNINFFDNNRNLVGSSSNFYFWAGGIADGEYRQIRSYIIGSEVDPKSVPDLLNADYYCQLNPGMSKAGLRVLNYYNGGTTTVDRWLNMSVTELGGGQISANQLLANTGLFNQLKSKIASFGGLTANEILADSALINKLVATSALFDTLQTRLAVFGGLNANSIAADAIDGNHIRAGSKIESPIIEGGEYRLIGANTMKIESETPFGPDNLIEWRGPKLLLNGQPNWPNIRKSNATRWTDVNGDEYFGGSLSAGILKTGVTNPDKNAYAVNTYPVEIGPFSSGGKSKTVVVSFSYDSAWNATSQPSGSSVQLSWQLQRKIGSGSWATVSSGTFNGSIQSTWEAEIGRYIITEFCNGSSTFTDTTASTSDFSYRVKVISHTRYSTTSNVKNQNLTVISTEQ